MRLVKCTVKVEWNKGNKLSRGSVIISASRDETADLIFEIIFKCDRFIFRN